MTLCASCVWGNGDCSFRNGTAEIPWGQVKPTFCPFHLKKTMGKQGGDKGLGGVVGNRITSGPVEGSR